MMWIVCNNIFVSNSVGGYVFSSRHSPPPAPDQRPYVKVDPTLVSISKLLHGPRPTPVPTPQIARAFEDRLYIARTHYCIWG